MLHRFAPTERMQLRGLDEFLHGFWIRPRVLSQRPADGLVDEKFLRAEILADDFAQQVKIGLCFVVQLEQDARPPQPEILRLAPLGESFFAHIGKALKVDADRIPRQRVHCVPPGFVRDEMLEGRREPFGQFLIQPLDETVGRVLVFAVGQSPQFARDGIQLLRGRESVRGDVFLHQDFELRRFDSQIFELVAHVSFHRRGLGGVCVLLETGNEWGNIRAHIFLPYVRTRFGRRRLEGRRRKAGGSDEFDAYYWINRVGNTGRSPLV